MLISRRLGVFLVGALVFRQLVG